MPATVARWSPSQRWIWAVVTILVVATQSPRLIRNWQPNKPEDFYQEWASARNVIEGLPVYAPHPETIPRYLGPDFKQTPNHLEVNSHPPSSILLAIPLVGLPYFQAHQVWNLVCLGALGASWLLIVRQLRLPWSPWSLLPMVTLILSAPVTGHLCQGQLGLVLLLLVVGSWSALRSGRPGLAGVLVGLAAAVKVYPALLLVLFALWRQWRAVLAGLTTLAAVSAGTVAWLGPGVYLEYARDVVPHLTQVCGGNAFNLSLAALFRKLFDPGCPAGFQVAPLVHCPGLAWLGAGVGGAVVLVVTGWAAARARSAEDRDLVFGLVVTAFGILSPVTWEHHLVVLLLPLTMLWMRLPATGLRRWGFWLLVALSCTSPREFCRPWGLYAVGESWPETGHPWHTLTLLSVHLYVQLVVFAWLAVHLGKSSDEPEHQGWSA